LETKNLQFRVIENFHNRIINLGFWVFENFQRIGQFHERTEGIQVGSFVVENQGIKTNSLNVRTIS
jgi:hypothetical protein